MSVLAVPHAIALAALVCAVLSAEASPAPGRPAVPATDVGAGAPAVPEPLPPPLPVPEAFEPEPTPPEAPGEPGPLPVEPDDALELLWGHRLDFAAGGGPLVTIRLADGQDELAVRVRGRARLRARGGAVLEVPAGAVLRVRPSHALPAALARYPLLAEGLYAERARLEAARSLWEARGTPVAQRLIGGIYGIAGRVVDNRRLVLIAATDGSERAAREFADRALAKHGNRTGTLTELVTRPSGQVEVLDPAGGRLVVGDALVSLEPEDDAGFELGSGAWGEEARLHRGRLHLTLDASGRLAAVLAVTLEELLRGLVPSEIPAGAPREALKAQAVTARSNVLAQIGTRHLTDPYGLCNEVHCQAYRGVAAHAATTDAAVRETRGEALFGRADRALVDAVYSAVCGGHGEDNDAVWPTLPSASLRGRPDLPPGAASAWGGGLAGEGRLRAFLEHAPPGWCARARGAPRERYRWRRRLSPAELDRLASPLGVGHVLDLRVAARGVSGRAVTLSIVGDRGRDQVEGELRIRRFLGNLPSAMFLVERDGPDLLLRGGGWGHGAGMCQWGAVGRATAGQGYREILGAYYSGAEVARIY